MTNKIAFFLALLIVAWVLIDAILFDWSSVIFMARKLGDLAEWIAFWR